MLLFRKQLTGYQNPLLETEDKEVSGGMGRILKYFFWSAENSFSLNAEEEENKLDQLLIPMFPSLTCIVWLLLKIRSHL